MKRQSLKVFVTTGLVATGVLTGSPAMASVDMFLKVDGIVGESTADKHKGEIDVLAWSWGQSVGAQTGKGLTPKVCIQDLDVTKYIDAASPDLIMNSLDGTVVPNVVLSVERGGQTPGAYLTLKMKNVQVTSYTTGGSGGEDRLTEHVTLRFESMEGLYRRQNPDGTLGQAVSFDVQAGAANCR